MRGALLRRKKMIAKFELEYASSSGVNVLVETFKTVEGDEDKRAVVETIAQLLGIKVEVPLTHAEQVFASMDHEGNEAHE